MRLTFFTAVLVLVLDQVSKWIVVRALDLDRKGALDVLPPWLNFRMAWNEGINFGLLSSSRAWMPWLLVAVSVAVSAWVWLWIRRGGHPPAARLAAGLLIGGAVGNAIDRLLYGAVADFLNMSLPGWTNPYSFNIADIAIFAGAVGLILFAGRDKAA
ncbi:MAG: signal peptidase II [Rhodobacteraceae bacterium]|nr:signal peptidase II [Paracoccaceae bacterium]